MQVQPASHPPFSSLRPPSPPSTRRGGIFYFLPKGQLEGNGFLAKMDQYVPKVGKWSEKGWPEQICCQKDRFFAQLAVFAVLIYWYPVRPSFWPVPVGGLHGDSPLQAQIFQPAGPPQGPKATPCSPWGGGGCRPIYVDSSDIDQRWLPDFIDWCGGAYHAQATTSQ